MTTNPDNKKDKIIDDIVITNTSIWAGKMPKPQTGWLAIKNGIIRETGSNDVPPPEAKQVINGQYKSVLPSFVDCHSHISAAAIANISKNGSAWCNKEDALNAIQQLAAIDLTSEWIVFFYMDWDAWDDPTPPTSQELEHASGGRNVLLVCESLHRGILSETGLRTTQVTRRTSQQFIEISKGIPNGIVWEESFSLSLLTALNAIIDSLGSEGIVDVMLAETQRHLAYGITDAHDPSITPPLSQIMNQVNEQSPLRISWSEVGSNGPISSADNGKQLELFGDGPSSAKVFTDGAHRCAMCIDPATAFSMTAKMFIESLKSLSIEPLSRMFRDDTVFSKGKIYRQGAIFTPTELTKRLQTLSHSHDRVKIHALGNHAVDMACDCIVESGLTTRVCLEHATFIDNQNLEKLAKHNIQVSLQPGFIPHYGDLMLKMHFGEKYRGLAARSMLDAGVELIMSSDNPCGPLDPLSNIRCAVERTLSDKRVYLPQEAVTQEEAVHAYTIAGPSGISGKPKKGIEVGAPADFIILTGDPFEHSTVVESTWINGEIVYQSGSQ